MSKEKSFKLTRRRFLEGSVGVIAGAGVACGSDKTSTQQPGGEAGAGGTGAATGGAPAGGASSGGVGTGGIATGGTGGVGTGGDTTSTGGAGTGGDTSTGGSAGTGGETTVTGGTSSGTGGAEGGAAGEGTGGAEGGAAGSTGTGGSGSTDNPLVALVRGNDWAQAVLDAIALVGGLPDLTGRTVLLKPNVISSNPCPETTSPAVIAGAIRAVRAMGATTVLVAEDGFYGTLSTPDKMQAVGITQVCTDEGAEPVELKDGPTTPLSPAAATHWANLPSPINLYQTVYGADYVINMPVCKTHSLTGYTLAMKNWFGCIPIDDRSHDNLTSSTLAARLAELHLAKQEDFVILDATRAMVTGGPMNGQAVESRVVVASRDAIIADVMGLCILKQYGTGSGSPAYSLGVWDQPQVIRALELGLPGWITSAQDFPYAQQGVDDIEEIMAHRNA